MVKRRTVLMVLLVLALPTESRALPAFAHRYGVSCQLCHSTVPHLTPFGTEFMRAGYRLPPNFVQRQTLPVSLKVNLQYSSEPDPNGLPKAIVDEVELLAGGTVSKHVSYRLEQYVVDGGEPGLTRDAFIFFTSRPTFGDSAPSLRFTGGQFTLPLPVDPETQRETINHYQIFDQKVGENPFDFFNDGLGLGVAYGREAHGTEIQVLALKGHDPQSGLQTSGVDTGIYAQSAGKVTTVSLYTHAGTRRFASVTDVFSRQGLGAAFTIGKADLNLVGQLGHDSHADSSGPAASSSGGFAQLRWAFSPGLTALMRYDSTYDPFDGSAQSLTTTLVVRLRRNYKFTLEDVAAGRHQTLSAALLFAY
jgi:hypothetical protein